MFGRKKNEETLQASLQHQADEARPGAKGRPTPTRREAEAARRRPLVPADRKAAATAAKTAEREERAKRQEAMRRGEEWALLPRDRGPERRWMRDFVDARWNVGEFLLPFMLVGLPLTFFDRDGTLVRVGFSVVYGAFAMFILDTLFMWFQLRRRYAERFGGAKPPRGGFFYAMSRSLSLRRTRMPLPQVKRGEKN